METAVKLAKTVVNESGGENKNENNERGQKTALQSEIEFENNKNGWKTRLQSAKKAKFDNFNHADLD